LKKIVIVFTEEPSWGGWNLLAVENNMLLRV